MPALRLSFLGEVRLTGPDGAEVRLPTRKALLLLALLAAAPDGKLSRDRATNLLWSNRQEAQARASLRQTIFLLHQHLPSSGLIANRDTLVFSRDLVWADVWALRAARGASMETTLDQVVAHPQVAARGMLVETKHPTAGTVKMVGVPVKLSETPGSVRAPAPVLGQHTGEVLRAWLGLTDEEIAALHAAGAVGHAHLPSP